MCNKRINDGLQANHRISKKQVDRRKYVWIWLGVLIENKERLIEKTEGRKWRYKGNRIGQVQGKTQGDQMVLVEAMVMVVMVTKRVKIETARRRSRSERMNKPNVW